MHGHVFLMQTLLAKLDAHYANLPMLYTEAFFQQLKFKKKIIVKILIVLTFLIKTLIVGTRFDKK